MKASLPSQGLNKRVPPPAVRWRRGWALALAWLLAALMVLGLFWVEHDKSVQALLERNLSMLAISWQATQDLQRYTVATYFEEYVAQPRTLALLQPFDEQQGLYAPWPASETFLIKDPHRLRADSPPPLRAAIEPLIARLGEHQANLNR